MEEIDFKLKQKNTILVAQAISKLLEIIKSKKQSTESNDKNMSDLNIPELQLLKSKCGVEDTNVNITACHGIVSLVEEGVLSVGSTLTDLMVILSSAQSPTGITMAIGNLLLLGIRRDLETNKIYTCPFHIQKPQHPLITILSQNYDIWREIFIQIQLFINHYDDKIALNSIELLRPVFFYIMCDPKSKLQDTARRQLWNLLAVKDDAPAIKTLTFEILEWIQNNTKQKCLELQEFLIESCIFALKTGKKEICTSLIIYLTSIMNSLVKFGCDPTPSISVIKEMLQLPSTFDTHSILLIILAETIIISPPIYLAEVLRLCKIIIMKQSSNLYAVKAIVASLLQWLFNPSKLSTELSIIANEIILYTNCNQTYSGFTSNLFRDNYFPYVQFADSNIDFILKLNLMAEKWQIDSKYLIDWLNDVEKMPPIFLPKLFNFISGIFVNQHLNSAINIQALNILMKIQKITKEVSYNILILILYKLANEHNSNTQITLLKALPLMAISKENIPIIISTLETIKNGPIQLKTLSFDLYLNLWQTEVRCFPYLQKLLITDNNSWEFGVAKAHTLKEICVKRPDLHGKEMVVYLSNILNKYDNDNGSAASALALEGIKILCEVGVVDIVSTWKNISPKFIKDKRPAVIKSLCEFLGEYSNLPSLTKDQEANINEVIIKLWEYVTYSEDKEVIEAALKSLSNFNIEQMSLKIIPDIYKHNIQIPASYAKTPVDAAKKPEDILPYIPGACWVQLLQKINHDAIEAAGNLLMQWIRLEIASYASNIYETTENKGEPLNYNYLPDKSIVRAIGNYLRLSIIPDSKIEYSENVARQSLRILGETYTKPLPPLNWTFLQEYLNKGTEIRRLAINLACKQILISISARKIIENYIIEFKPCIDRTYEMSTLFSNLNHLCKGIAPNTLRPMITNSLSDIYKRAITNDPFDFNTGDIFKEVVQNIKTALLDKNIHEANRTLLGQIIENLTEGTSGDDKVFDVLIECLVETPSKYVDRISCPSLWWAITDEKFIKAIKVRCYLAKNADSKPFAYLNECINTAATLPSVQIYTLKNLFEVFQHHSQHPSISDWILDLMGKIQEKISNEKSFDEIIYLCDIFLMAIITFSGYMCLNCPTEIITIAKDVRFQLFPNALFHFLSERYQNVSTQVLEWLYHMVDTCTDLPSSYQMIFYQSIIMLRHEKAFCESTKWMKYVSLKRPNY